MNKPKILAMKNSARMIFLFGMVAFGAVTLIVHQAEFSNDAFALWFFRFLIVLVAVSMSTSIPGMLEIKHAKDSIGVMNLAEREPAITSSLAIAVLVLVFFFNAIGLIETISHV